MTTIPTISEEIVAARVGEQSFQRGLSYFRNGAIFDARRQGTTLKARCEGSRPQAYRVQVTFDGNSIAGANCSCPVGAGGYCKHVAALLLTWIDRPEEFVEVEDLDTALERRSKEELITLIKQMLRREPELEVMLETPLPTDGVRRTPIDAATYRRQVAAAFRRSGDDWETESRIGEELSAVTAIADGFLQQQDYTSAAIVYEAVAAEVLEHYASFHDEFGYLSSAVTTCVEGLGQCLAAEKTNAAPREAILRALFAIYRFDVDYGGVGLGDEVPDLILEHAMVEERRTIACWVRDALPQGTDWSDNYRRQRYGGFLLELESDALDDEAFLQICRETGRTHDLVDRLLTLARVDEAMHEAEQVGDYDLLQLAGLFVRRGHEDVAERLMEQRSQRTKDTRVLAWLKDRYVATDPSAALELAEKIFRMRPSFEDYKEVRELSRQLGCWDAMHRDLLAFLREERQVSLLLWIYLDEGEIDRALEMVQSGQAPGVPQAYGYYASGYYGTNMALEVAKAAEETRPHAAREIYRQQAEHLIALRGRGNYQVACELLSRVRALYERLGETDTWTSYISDLRERNRSLRALKEELTSAGL